ncbi:MAG: mevalonate kinase [Chloroflexi bacterium]|nr:mevalonate kinase [Chloroflexota bacterium]
MTRSATASAPGKVILFGEHAVVYGRPAIAAPVMGVQATASVTPNPAGGIRLLAPDLGEDQPLAALPADHPLGTVIRAALAELYGRPGGSPSHPGVSPLPDLLIRVTSEIPIASGLGSGAAIATAIVRALALSAGRPLADEEVSRLVYQSEKLYHGAPSGVDNTVIAFRRPVYFVRGQPLTALTVPVPFHLVIGDTGVASPTKLAVEAVRRAWEAGPARYEALFDEAEQLARAARGAIEGGEPQRLDPLMDHNHALPAEMGVSTPELERLVAAARAAGAGGAKLSGGGRGGNMIALVTETTAPAVTRALLAAGAPHALLTLVGPWTHPSHPTPLPPS